MVGVVRVWEVLLSITLIFWAVVVQNNGKALLKRRLLELLTVIQIFSLVMPLSPRECAFTGNYLISFTCRP